MKHLKSKLMVAIVMLAISAIMLGGASFAWYTLSTNPEVTNIKANVAANENLEIALDNGYANETAVDNASKVASTEYQGSTTGNPYTWGNLIDLNTAMTTMNPGAGAGTGATPQLALAPVKYVDVMTGDPEAKTSGKLQFPKYGIDGRISSTNNDLYSDIISDHSSVSTASGGVIGYKQAEDDESTADVNEGSTVYDALSVTYWLRSNEDCDVTLTAKAERAKSANDSSAATTDVNGVVGNGSYIAFKVSGENTEDIITEYAKNVVVKFDVYSGTTPAFEKSIWCKLTKVEDPTAGTDSSFVDSDYVYFQLVMINKLNSAFDATTDTITGETGKTDVTDKISLTADTAKKVQMWIYVDGETLTNKSALLDECSMKLNIQFQSSEIGKEGDASNEYAPGALNGTTATAN